MLGIGKKVERVRKALHDAFTAKANALIKESTMSENDPAGVLTKRIRALVLLDVADVLRTVAIDEKDVAEEDK